VNAPNCYVIHTVPGLYIVKLVGLIYLYALLAVSKRQAFWIYSSFGSSHLLTMFCIIPLFIVSIHVLSSCVFSFMHSCFFINGNFCFTTQEAHALRVLENKVLKGASRLNIEKLTAE
jgi:hypothetical protein